MPFRVPEEPGMNIRTYLWLAMLLCSVLLTADPARGEEKSQPIAGTVCDAAGEPVAGAEVSLIQPSRGGRLDDRGRFQVMETSPQTQSDDQGRFTFEPVEGTFSLLAQGPAGYAVVTSEAFGHDARVTLRPWGRIEGTFRQAGKAMARARLNVDGSWPDTSQGNPYVRFTARATTDDQGRFVFDQVAAGASFITYRPGLEMTRFVLNGCHYIESTDWSVPSVEPGQVLTLALGDVGRPVVGRIAPPPAANAPADFDMSLVTGTLMTASDQPPVEWPEACEEMSVEQRTAWYKSPEGVAWLRRARATSNRPWAARFFTEADGTFRIEDVPPGRYEVRIEAMRQAPSGTPTFRQVPPMGTVLTYLTVPPPENGAAWSDAPFDAGTQTLFFSAGPAKVGEAAPLFDVKGMDGQPIRLADFRGRHVLVSFWARGVDWMMPAIRDVHQRFGKDGKLAVIQFNMDPNADPKRIREYLARHKTPGLYALIGTFSESQVQVDYFQEGCLQLVFLIGPDGKVLAKDLTAENLAEKVAEAMGDTAKAQ